MSQKPQPSRNCRAGAWLGHPEHRGQELTGRRSGNAGHQFRRTRRHDAATVLAVTGAHQYEQVVEAVHEAAPANLSPYIDLIPDAGLKLTPRHYAYLKISEG